MTVSAQAPASFPRALLEQPISARLNYFETKVSRINILKQVHSDLLHAIRHPAGLRSFLFSVQRALARQPCASELNAN